MISSPQLAGRDRYERTIEAWVDNTHADAFTHTVRVADPDRAIEVRAVCTPSPGYEVREAFARVLGGDADPAIALEMPDLAGARMIQGFTRRLAGLFWEEAAAADGTLAAGGLRYESRLPPGWECWALWEPLALEPANAEIEQVHIEMPALRGAAELLGVWLRTPSR